MPLNLNDQLNAIGRGLLPTPTAVDHKSRGPNSKQVGLDNFFKIYPEMKWPTPRASEWKGCGPKGSKSQVTMLEKGYLSAAVTEQSPDGGSLNPTWVEWLMGYPTGWTDLEPWAMRWFRPKRGKPLKDSSE